MSEQEKTDWARAITFLRHGQMVKTIDISGMGGREHGGYEWGCQVIKARALHFLRSLPKDFEWPILLTNECVVGVSISANETAKKMEEFALDHAELRVFGATGAMVQYSLEHARRQFEMGDDAYFAAFSDDPDRLFEWESQDAFPEL